MAEWLHWRLLQTLSQVFTFIGEGETFGKICVISICFLQNMREQVW